MQGQRIWAYTIFVKNFELRHVQVRYPPISIFTGRCYVIGQNPQKTFQALKILRIKT